MLFAALLGAALKLHPLAVLSVSTAGAILFGALGGIVAAPLLKIALDTSRQLKAAGLFDEPGDAGRGASWLWRGDRGGKPAPQDLSGSTPGTP
jgi:predicted PurR-regulated permease PerM